jgi:hypothetical protein
MAILFNENFDETIPFSDVCVQLFLATSTAQSYTIPGTAQQRYTVKFQYSSDSNVFVSRGASFTVPASNAQSTQQYCEFKPGYGDGCTRYASGGDVLYFITPDTAGAYMSIRLMSLPG